MVGASTTSVHFGDEGADMSDDDTGESSSMVGVSATSVHFDAEDLDEPSSWSRVASWYPDTVVGAWSSWVAMVASLDGPA